MLEPPLARLGERGAHSKGNDDIIEVLLLQGSKPFGRGRKMSSDLVDPVHEGRLCELSIT